MPVTLEFNNPVMISLAVLAVLIWGSSAYVTYDALHRRKTDYAGVLEGRWFYAGPQAAFFVAFAANAPWINNMLLVLPVALAQQMAYLLRVVYPTGKRLEKRLDAECELLREEVEDSAGKLARTRAADVDGFFDPDRPND
jgi:hypothetical protein